MRIVIVGAGETGISLATDFSQAGGDVVLVDRSSADLLAGEEGLDVMSLVGEATHADVLARAGVKSADAFVAVTGSDSDNVVSAAMAKVYGAKVSVARVDDPAFYRTAGGLEHGTLGIDYVLCATRLASSALVGRMVGLDMSFSDAFAAQSIRIGTLTLPEGHALVGKRAENLDLGDRVKVVGVVRDGFLRQPVDANRLEATDALLLSGESESFLDAWMALVPERKDNRVLVVGGGAVGAQIALVLAQRFERIELVELDADRARALADENPKIRVIVGDARKSAFLKDLQIESVQHLIVVTGDDEVNLLVSLLGRKLGVESTFTLLRTAGHTELFRELGVRGALSTFEVLADSIRESATPAGHVRSVDLPDTGYGVYEYRLPALSGATPLSKMPLPPDVRPIGIARYGEFLGTHTNRKLTGDETVLLLAPKRISSKIEGAVRHFVKELSS